MRRGQRNPYARWRKMRLARLLFVGAALSLLSACGGQATAGGQTVSVTLNEFHLKLDRSAIPAGQVTFQIANQGKEKHEFVILRTDLAVNALPNDPQANKVQEEATRIEHIDEIDRVDAGAQQVLTVDLNAD